MLPKIGARVSISRRIIVMTLLHKGIFLHLKKRPIEMRYKGKINHNKGKLSSPLAKYQKQFQFRFSVSGKIGI